MVVAITGAAGQLGHDLIHVTEESGDDVHALRHEDVDVTDAAAVLDAFRTIQPSAVIKQGFNAVNVITVDGQIITGVPLQSTEQQLRIRDAKDNEQVILSDDIDELLTSPNSLMPSGLTEGLSRNELVDLVNYLSSLGRIKEPTANQ